MITVVYNRSLLARDFHRFGQKSPIWEKLDTSLLRHKSKNKRKFDPEHAFYLCRGFLKNVYEKGTFEIKTAKTKY